MPAIHKQRAYTQWAYHVMNPDAQPMIDYVDHALYHRYAEQPGFVAGTVMLRGYVKFVRACTRRELARMLEDVGVAVCYPVMFIDGAEADAEMFVVPPVAGGLDVTETYAYDLAVRGHL